jgi:hypothetical protein
MDRDKQERFLTAFVEHRGDVEAARRESGIDRRTFYRWIEDDALFRDRLDRMRLLLAEEVEGEAFRRALASKGSDNIVITLLRGLKRERYGEAADNRVLNVVYVSGLRRLPRPGVQDAEALDSGSAQTDGSEGDDGSPAADSPPDGPAASG